jgi:alkanesulfonate monooxygenase SsuD/methylene tetrahydromethanopterin reductase-like flavin-dependent oxidoreductase (luciferase family)
MGTLRFGIKVSQAATIDTLKEVWRIADEAGFDHCWNMDHFASLGGDDTLTSSRPGPRWPAWRR